MNRLYKHCAFMAVLFFIASASLQADVSLPGVFGDNMVLQRGMKVPVKPPKTLECLTITVTVTEDDKAPVLSGYKAVNIAYTGEIAGKSGPAQFLTIKDGVSYFSVEIDKHTYIPGLTDSEIKTIFTPAKTPEGLTITVTVTEDDKAPALSGYKAVNITYTGEIAGKSGPAQFLMTKDGVSYFSVEIDKHTYIPGLTDS